MPLYIQIALGIMLAVLLLTQASMLRGLIDRVVNTALQVVREILRALERIFSILLRPLARR